MALVSDIQLKQYFETGDFPTQQQFFDLIDSKLNINDISLLPSTNLTIGTTPINSGYVGGILFETTGNVLGQSANYFWDNTNTRLGIGTQSPLTVISVVSSLGNTDSATLTQSFKRTNTANSNTTWAQFRAYNSSDIIIGQWGLFQETAGGGNRFSVSLSQTTISGAATEKMRLNSTGFLSLGTSFKNGALIDLHLQGSLSTDLALRVRNFADTINAFEIRGDHSLAHYTDGTPTASVTDGYLQYSSDINGAGSAGPHFRTEDGKIIKLYQYTTAIASATHVGVGATNIHLADTYDGYTIAQIVKALRNLGILA
jgi:hypothetical protein